MQEDTIPNLKPWQLKVLSIPSALDRFYKEYPGLEVSVEPESRTATVKAPEDMMKHAFSDVLAFTTNIKERRISLNPALAMMYKKLKKIPKIGSTKL